MATDANMPAATAQNSKNSRAVIVQISSEMRISDILALLPDAGSLLAQYGLHCAGCAFGGIETLAQGCTGHGYSDEEIAELVVELNRLFTERPARPSLLTVTRTAAEHLRAIADAEGRGDDVLEVIADERGGFCLEFQPSLSADAPVFGHPDVHLRITASPLTLARIGGATIDFRDERFKLDLPEDSGECCGEKGECSCNT